MKTREDDKEILEVHLIEAQKKLSYAHDKIDKLNKKVDELQDELDWQCGRGIYSSKLAPFNECFSRRTL